MAAIMRTRAYVEFHLMHYLFVFRYIFGLNDPFEIKHFGVLVYVIYW